MAITPMEVYKLLPKTNCKKCGEATCMSFAFKVINRERKLEDCTPLFEEKKYAPQLEELKKMLKGIEEATETGLIVDEELCSGCANCVVVCPVHASDDPYGMGSGYGPTIDDPILRIEDGVVKVINMKKCRRYGKNRILCVACRENCPSDAIRFVEG
ncbi:formylmethanofuran dehydrogenase, subunit G [Archaeoglobus sulfaticallidus PM70-1]|uniref:Formylmethanofuran dehydrogenase, subunit G n=1 Tax=Archaeoglobus sulfaticallidus PM70-1 TaxID=387631 RepID=N0BB20_9EURY|nr:(Fe-S)-binding protein [Archaeoglobus sulfaticallidus]AGK60804.1 formylmethanofuran dehydrogenase, subunit G [Archaeoglobus sulfaticallidus PM70-1]